MGLSRAAVTLLIQEAARRPLTGSLCTLGRQHVYVTAAELARVAEQHGVALTPVSPTLHREPSLAARGYISDDCLFACLGFTRTVRLDYSNYEAPDVIFDLNERQTPDDLARQFDVLLDSGTLEHIFNLPAALAHCVRMVKPGGRIIHLTPSSNCLDHGLYSVSPTLYADFYEASGFRLEQLLLCRLPLLIERGWWQIYDYPLKNRQTIPLGRLDGSIWFTWAVVTAGADPRPAEVQQSHYVHTWSDHERDDQPANADWTVREPADSRAGKLLASVGHVPVLGSLAKASIVAWRWLVSRYRERFRGRLPFRYVGRI